MNILLEVVTSKLPIRWEPDLARLRMAAGGNFSPLRGGKSPVIQFLHIKHFFSEKSQNFSFELALHVSSSATVDGMYLLLPQRYQIWHGGVWNTWSCNLEVVISESFLNLNQAGQKLKRSQKYPFLTLFQPLKDQVNSNHHQNWQRGGTVSYL